METHQAIITELQRLSEIIRSCGEDDVKVGSSIWALMNVARATDCLGDVNRWLAEQGDDSAVVKMRNSFSYHFYSDKTPCGAKLKQGQWWGYCGETDMGQTPPVRCFECGGNFEREEDEKSM